MELMDTSLDKFYKKVIEKGETIPEDILGKITVAVRPVPYFYSIGVTKISVVFTCMKEIVKHFGKICFLFLRRAS